MMQFESRCGRNVNEFASRTWVPHFNHGYCVFTRQGQNTDSGQPQKSGDLKKDKC